MPRSVIHRSGVVDADGGVQLDPAGPLAETGERRAAVYERRHFADKLRELGADPALTGQVMERLPRHFGQPELDRAIAVLDDLPRATSHESVKLLRWLSV